MRLDADARHALSVIQDCIAGGRYRLLRHFTKRMDRRGLFWPDVLAVIEKPEAVKDDGTDRYGRPKWIIDGDAADGKPLEVVCALDEDDDGKLTVFITLYWKD